VTVIPLYDEAQPFYAPAFEVKLAGASGVAGRPMPRDVVRDAVEVTYQDSLERVDSFTLVFSNWNADTRRPLFLGAGADDPPLFDLVQPGNEVQLLMGYEGRAPDLRVMTTGFITTLEADFPESGAPRLTVRGLNVLDRFRIKQFTWAWPQDGVSTITDSAIARDLEREPDSPPGRPGLGRGVRVRINDAAAQREAPQDYVMMNNQYPIVFLMERARRNGYDLFLGRDPGQDAASAPQPFLYFGPSERVADRTYRLERGKSLVSFKPTISTARQVKKVTVLGWDRRRKQAIRGEATLSDLAHVNPDLHAFIESTGREEVVTDQPVSTAADARRVAVRYLEAQALELVEATGVVPGLPDLRAGRVLEIGGFDRRLDGRWFVKETTHTINDSGYRTTFVARRERERLQ
jgi:phage protein D